MNRAASDKTNEFYSTAFCKKVYKSMKSFKRYGKIILPQLKEKLGLGV